MTTSIVDARLIPAWERHATIFDHFDGLALGQDFSLLTDHDPVPLLRQFHSMRPDEFDWTYEERGPEEWRVRISRTAKPPVQRDGNCCGCCGG